MKIIFILFISLILCHQINAHEKEGSYTILLDSLAKNTIPQLNNEVDISFSNISIKELIRTIGNTTGVNITIDPNINYSVNSNFNKVKAADVINFLCTRYNLQLSNIGSIIHLQPVVVKEEKLSIELIGDSIISYEARKIVVTDFFREFTNKTGFNFILSPELGNALINGYAQNISIKSALFYASV